MDWDTAMQNMIAAEVQKHLVPLEWNIRDLQDVGNETVATRRAQEHAFAKAMSDLQRRIAALEYTRTPVSEIEPQELDEAMRERLQPLRDDLDDLVEKVKRLDRAVDDRLTTLEEDAQTASRDLSRVVEIATKDVQARMSALEGRSASEAPANDSQAIESICAALEAEYVAFARSAVKSGLSHKEASNLLVELHINHAYKALRNASGVLVRMYVAIDAESQGEAA